MVHQARFIVNQQVKRFGAAVKRIQSHFLLPALSLSDWRKSLLVSSFCDTSLDTVKSSWSCHPVHARCRTRALDNRQRPGFSKNVLQARSAGSRDSRNELTTGGSAVEGVSMRLRHVPPAQVVLDALRHRYGRRFDQRQRAFITRDPTNAQNGSSCVYRTAYSGSTCRALGCASPRYVDPNEVAGNFCTRTQRPEACVVSKVVSTTAS